MFSKSWKRSVKPSGLSWMEDMTTSSASWHPVWDWRNRSWRMPYWKEIRQLGFILCFFVKAISYHCKLIFFEKITATTSSLNWIYPIWFYFEISDDVSYYESCVTPIDRLTAWSNSLLLRVSPTSCSSTRSQSQEKQVMGKYFGKGRVRVAKANLASLT